MDIIVPQSVLSDLSYLRKLNPPLVHYIVRSESNECRWVKSAGFWLINLKET